MSSILRNAPFFAVSLALAACFSSSTSSSPNGSSGGTSSGGTTQNDPSCAPNQQDGNTACSSSTCTPGQWCDHVVCNDGCTATSNCATGQYCDLSNPSTFGENKVGTCRTPTQQQVTACTGKSSGGGGGGSCSDVHGVYTVSGDPAHSSTNCTTKTQKCTVAQTNCDVTFTCEQSTGVNTVTLDANDKGTSTSPGPQGSTITCAVSFAASAGTVAIDCTITASGASAECVINGSK